MSTHVVVVIGAGDMGIAIARRVGSGRTVILADRDADLLHARAEELAALGHTVVAHEVDVTSEASVGALAGAAAAAGAVMSVVHTAGVSPLRASIESILAVDLLGTAWVLDAFHPVVAAGGSGLVVASMAAVLFPQPAHDVEVGLALTTADGLLHLPAAQPASFTHPAEAYAFAKQANIVRVAALSRAWGARGATLNAISPGVISTAMGRRELAGENGAAMRELTELSGTGRIGTPDDIASAAEFLLSPGAGFITGVNLVVDGGVTAAVRF